MNHSERIERAEAVAQRGLYTSKHEYVKAIVAAYLGDDTVYVIDPDAKITVNTLIVRDSLLGVQRALVQLNMEDPE